VVRVKFFAAGVPGVFLGAGLAWYFVDVFRPLDFTLTLLGVILAMAGCYTFNEYFDYRSRADVAIPPEQVTPFSAGSRVLPQGLLSPRAVLRAGIVFWLLAGIIGIYLTLTRGWWVAFLAGAGFFTGALYTMPPFKWAYRGLGEAFIGITYGPLIALGSYYVQVATINPLPQVLLPTLVPGFLITAVIWINEFPDYFADKEVGKRNLVVRLGKRKASTVYFLLLLLPYATILLGLALGLVPLLLSIVFITLPLVYKNLKLVKAKYEEVAGLVPAMSGTIALFTLTTLLLTGGYLLSSVL